ncbi:sensor histidine kinase [Gordonia liuliyuniae]|uniref:histidine kinase n=1 Tax=Gordonia liuliyuniae TaxID=2911517 RepID=A0ABS9IX17_9ACTN|nr:histidine kinase [Gordonia liuliyuniae]MCF8590108.1 histidine kinase [Gordonia liuliyuniae]
MKSHLGESDPARPANLTAVGTFAVGLLLWACGAFTFFSDHDVYPWYAKLLLLTAALGIALAARERPALAFGVMCALLAVDAVWGPSLPLWIAMSDIVFLCAVRGTHTLQRVVIAVCTILTLGLAVVGALAGGVRVGVLVGLIGIAFLLSPITYARAVTAARRASEAEKTAAVSRADAERTEAVSDERRRLSRDLHDTVAGHVSAIAILSEAARGADEPSAIVDSIRRNSLAALGELRTMIDVLAADGDERTTIRWASLEPLIAAADAVGSTVTVDGDLADLPHHVEAVLTRIAGEAIANATRHAPGHAVSVVVADLADRARLTVRNEMPAGAADAGAGRGVLNMQVRAESIGGRADAGPDGGHWVVTAEVPR